MKINVYIDDEFTMRLFEFIFLYLFQSAGNGYIEYPEFQRLIGHQMVIANYKNKCLRQQFEVFDKDGDGFITGWQLFIFPQV